MATKMEFEIADTLKTLGVAANGMGYFYLKYAVELVASDISLVRAITKRLYPMVAKKFETKPSRVERVIRHAISEAWNRGSATAQNKLFGYTIDQDSGVPTNGNFIITVADWCLMVCPDEEVK